MQGLYSPTRDIQRFCTLCKRWYHVSCLKSPEDPSLRPRLKIKELSRGGEEELLKACLVPIERGPALHGIAGNGEKQLLLRSLLHQDAQQRSDWKNAVGAGYSKMVLTTSPAYFACPSCSSIV